nr:MAG TPA: Protein of unknown function (DUF3785) [Caudoviricetes sp.]
MNLAAISTGFQFQIINLPDFFRYTSDNNIIVSKISKKYKGLTFILAN